jgi:hypothetical protein
LTLKIQEALQKKDPCKKPPPRENNERTGCKDKIKRKSRRGKTLNMVGLNLQPLTRL